MADSAWKKIFVIFIDLNYGLSFMIKPVDERKH
jgi:hypothetical protein